MLFGQQGTDEADRGGANGSLVTSEPDCRAKRARTESGEVKVQDASVVRPCPHVDGVSTPADFKFINIGVAIATVQ